MTTGTLYGIGVGPGDPEWMTVKAARILSTCRHVCVPRSDLAADSVALEIARVYLRPDAVVHEQSFPMTADPSVLQQHWQAAAREVHEILSRGEDCCFLTLGDALLYSTYIYLLRELQAIDPAVRVVTVPGVTAFSAAAALANRPVGEGKQLVTIVPASDDFSQFAEALDRGGTVVLMKVGRRLERVLDELEARNLLDQAVFVSHAGMPQQHVETDLRRLRGLSEKAGYLSILIIQASPPEETGQCRCPRRRNTHESLFCGRRAGRSRAVDRQSPPALGKCPLVHLCRFAGESRVAATASARSRAIRFGRDEPGGDRRPVPEGPGEPDRRRAAAHRRAFHLWRDRRADGRPRPTENRLRSGAGHQRVSGGGRRVAGGADGARNCPDRHSHPCARPHADAALRGSFAVGAVEGHACAFSSRPIASRN